MRFALEQYDSDPCDAFHLDYREDEYDIKDVQLDEKMHKAIAIIQFKLEGQLMKRRPEFQMDQRLLLDKMDLEQGTVTVEGKTYPLKDTCFPTVDMKNP